MKQYIIRRLLQMIPIIIGVSILIFFICQLAPGDAFTGISDPKMTAERKAELRHKYHLDENVFVQYGYWATGIVKGDWGESLKYNNQPVTKVINTYIWNSFILSITSFLASILLAIPLGIISATKQYSKTDYGLTLFALVGISLPSFFISLLFIKWFAVDFEIFPVSGMYTPGSDATGFAQFQDLMHHMFLPFLVLTVSSIAGLMRYTRSSMLEVVRQDYIRTARAKGLREKVVIYKHALRNALIPVITIFGMSLPGLFSGAIILEGVFNWPGIGPVELNAVYGRDYPLLMGINMLMAILILIGNLIADVSYAIADPRIRLK